MANKQSGLLFDIDLIELQAAQDKLEATDWQLNAAYNRAIKRTAVTMKSQGSKLLGDGMDAKSLKEVRKRMQTHQSPFKITQDERNFNELKLWFGLNDMSIGRLKGRVSRLGRKRSPVGAAFTSKKLGKTEYQDGFVGRVRGKRSIFARKGAARFPVREKKVAVSDAVHIELEDDIFVNLPDVFMRHFTTDLKSRVVAGNIIAGHQRKWK